MPSSQEIFENKTPNQCKIRLKKEKKSRYYKKQKTQHRTDTNLLIDIVVV